jgi:opacity protein-like surface antigen
LNVGGGVKINLAGPLRLRLDYRVFTLQGSQRDAKPQRFYAGVNLKF